MTTFVSLLVTIGHKPPYRLVSAIHNFYLRGTRLVMVPEISKQNWKTFTKLVETSERLHRKNLPLVLSRNSSSSKSLSDVTTVSEFFTNQNKKQEIRAAASARVEQQPLTKLAARVSKIWPAKMKVYFK